MLTLSGVCFHYDPFYCVAEAYYGKPKVLSQEKRSQLVAEAAIMEMAAQLAAGASGAIAAISYVVWDIPGVGPLYSLLGFIQTLELACYIHERHINASIMRILSKP